MAKTPAPKSKTKDTNNAQASLSKQLALVLSDTYVLAVKTHGYHWNVTGPNFGPLHTMFEQQYHALILAADEYAERIRALDFYPDGSMDSFMQNTVIKEAGTKPLSAPEMLKDLHKSYQQLQERLIETEDMADDIDDLVTQDMLTQQISANEKTMWMIRAHIE